MLDIQELYRKRFPSSEAESRARLWQTLCRFFFQEEVGNEKMVVDLGCGYCEFINAIKARQKFGVDLNPDSSLHAEPDVKVFHTDATSIPLGDNSVDVVFTSNFLEHLPDKDRCTAVLLEARRILVPGGKFIALGPNIRYLPGAYWDFYDHYIPLSHLSLSEALQTAGYTMERVIPKFIPYTTKSDMPQANWMIALYLKLPLAWRILGKQFLLVAHKSH